MQQLREAHLRFGGGGGGIVSHEFTLDELGLAGTDDWEGYDYMVLEIRSSTPQRFLLGIDTDNGLHEKRTHVLPKAWVRLCIPLDYYREKPRPSNDLASTVNKPQNGVGFQHIEGLYIAEVLGEGIRITGRPNSRRVTANWGSGHCAMFAI